MEDKKKELYFSQEEVKYLKSIIKRLVNDLHDQTQENMAEREQLGQMFNKYDELYQQYELMKEENDMLKAQYESLPQPMNKQTVMSMLNQNANAADDSSKKIEKSLIKGEIDLKQFMNNYVDNRKVYHKYQLLKVKVSQS